MASLIEQQKALYEQTESRPPTEKCFFCLRETNGGGIWRGGEGHDDLVVCPADECTEKLLHLYVDACSDPGGELPGQPHAAADLLAERIKRVFWQKWSTRGRFGG